MAPLALACSMAWLGAAYADSGNGNANANANANGKAKGTTGQQGNGNGKGTTGGQGPAGDTAPSAGSTVDVAPASGKVFMRVPGSKVTKLLDGSELIPVGAHIDARHGKVTLTTAVGSGGATQTATFWGGVFTVTQAGNYTVITLPGRPRSCAPAASATAVAARRKPTRRLWAHDDHGKFRTHGQNSVATVRGTTWLTVESCSGTRTRVTEGTVSVRDLRAHRIVLVKAGHSYLARTRRAR